MRCQSLVWWWLLWSRRVCPQSTTIPGNWGETPPLQCQSESFYHGAGSELTVAPGSPSFQLSSSEGHRSRHTTHTCVRLCHNVGHTVVGSCIITGIGQNLQNIEKTTEFMFSFLKYSNFLLICSRSVRRSCLFSPAWSPGCRSGGDTFCTRLARHNAKIIRR